MLVNGKEVHFKATVRAVLEIAEQCPEGDINRVEELFGKVNKDTLLASIRFLTALTNGATTEDDWLDMDVRDLQGIMDEAMRSFRKDQKPTVEVKVKKDEATAAVN